MMYRLALSLLPLVCLAACGPSPQQHTAQLLDKRLETGLAKDVAAGRAAVQRVPDGVRVTLLTPNSFADDPMTMDDAYPDIRASVIEGMLDPRLMRVAVADTAPLSEDQREARVYNVRQYFIANGLADTLVSAPEPLATAPAGLAITIGVYCPKPDGLIGYGSGKSKPVCE